MKCKIYTSLPVLLLILCCLLSNIVVSQIIIKGNVLDAESKQPLDAVFIAVNNSKDEKAVTDNNGNFSLRISKENNTLTATHIGYKPVSIILNGATTIKIVLNPEAINLEDIKLQPGTVGKFSSLTKVDLALNPVKSTQELLRLVPGLFIAQHAGGGKAEQIFLRGFDVDHGTDVQVSVDGMPVNMVSHAHGQGYADAHFIIPETINNIDFGTGPYYAGHGNLNTAGYVAFSTFKNIAKSKVQTEVGRFNSFRTVALIDLIKKNKEKQSAYIAGDFFYGDGPTENKQDFNRFNFFGKYNASITHINKLLLQIKIPSSNINKQVVCWF